MKPNPIRKILTVIANFLAVLFILLGTTLMVLYSRGYRLNQGEGQLEKTGVISIETDPTRATILVDGKESGRTSKTVDGVIEGEHTITLKREGYIDWIKTLYIPAERSTPLYAKLFPDSYDAEEVFKIDGELTDITQNEFKNFIFIVTRKIINPDPVNTQTVYSIWRYNTQPNFWDLSQNPILLYEEQLTNIKSFESTLSPDGRKILLMIESGLTDQASSTLSAFMLDTSERNSKPAQFPISEFLPSYQIAWSKDSRFLIVESEEEIVSIDASSEIKYLITKKSESTKTDPWTTDFNSNIYFVRHIAKDEESGKAYFQIVKQALSSSKSEIVVDKIFYQETDRNIKDQELEELQKPFTTSPDNGRFSGKILSIDTPINERSFVLTTEFASYRLDTIEGKYTLVSPFMSDLIVQSPEAKSLLFQSEDTVGVFIFDKEDQDHTVQLGSSYIIQQSDIDSISAIKQLSWHSNSRYLFYMQGEEFHVIDRDGDNKYKLLTLQSEIGLLDGSSRYLYTVEPNQFGQSLVRYSLE